MLRMCGYDFPDQFVDAAAYAIKRGVATAQLFRFEEIVIAHPQHARLDCDLDPLIAEIDPIRFKLLVKNLLDNASEHGGTGAIEIKLGRAQNELCLEVRDHGPGIAAEEIPRLTEAFYRPDSARQRDTGGYGLGLYLCHLIVVAHGGEMHIDSAPGQGTRVTVKLPR